jgi:DNA-binding response OmpR family regulator
MISARTGDADRSTGLRMGADAFLRKPLRVDELLETVAGLYSGRE